MARPSPSCAHDDDRLRLPPASPSRSNSAEKKESTVRRLSQLCPPCATPSSNSSLDYRRSDARIVKNGFAASSGVSKSAKVVLGSGVTTRDEPLRQREAVLGDVSRARVPDTIFVLVLDAVLDRLAQRPQSKRLPDDKAVQGEGKHERLAL